MLQLCHPLYGEQFRNKEYLYNTGYIDYIKGFVGSIAGTVLSWTPVQVHKKIFNLHYCLVVMTFCSMIDRTRAQVMVAIARG
jgi:hypothetical protein